MRQVIGGTTRDSLNLRELRRLEIPVAPEPQRSALLHLVDRVIHLKDSSGGHLVAARRAVERFRQTVLAAACAGRLTTDWREAHTGGPSIEHALSELSASRKKKASREQAVDLELPSLPESYFVGTIGDAATSLEYGTSKRTEADPDEGVPVLRMGNIQEGALDLRDLKYIRLDAEIERLLLADGDILFNRTNSPELVGKSAVFRNAEAPMSFASYLIRVRLHPDIAVPEFVNYWINSAWGRLWARQAKTDGVSQSNINGSKLALMPIPLPPVDEQRLIVSRAGQLLDQAERLRGRVDTGATLVQKTSQATLSRAFRGGLAARSARRTGVASFDRVYSQRRESRSGGRTNDVVGGGLPDLSRLLLERQQTTRRDARCLHV